MWWKRPCRLTAGLLCSLVVVSPSVSFAQVRPDAGETLRDLSPAPSILPKKSVAPLTIEDASGATASVDATTEIPIERIVIKGNTVFPAEELHALVADLEKGKHTLADLDAGIKKITTYYRDRGYLVARAYIPEQKMTDGLLTVAVLEGNLGASSLSNSSSLSDDEAAPYIKDHLSEGEILRSSDIDRATLLLADTPGVGGAKAVLRPGQSVGTSDLVIEVDPGKPYEGSIGANNFGNRYTGEYQFDGQLAVNNPFGIGDQMQFRLLGSNDNLYYGRAGYQLPIGTDGLKLGFSYAQTSYKLGKDFSSLGAHGTAAVGDIHVTYPFIRSLTTNLYGVARFEDKRLRDRTDTPFSASDKNVQAATIGLVGSHRDDLGGGGVTMLELNAIGGVLGMDAASRAIDSVTAKTDGGWARMTYSLARLQSITEDDQAFVHFSGQRASKNLGSSEEITIGGADGVRAFPQGEGAGDKGWLANFEVRHSLLSTEMVPALQAIAFYDLGSVTVDEKAFSDDKNTRTIAGTGLGLNATFTWGLHLKSYVAWRTAGGASQSDSQDRNPRVWFQLYKEF